MWKKTYDCDFKKILISFLQFLFYNFSITIVKNDIDAWHLFFRPIT